MPQDLFAKWLSSVSPNLHVYETRKLRIRHPVYRLHVYIARACVCVCDVPVILASHPISGCSSSLAVSRPRLINRHQHEYPPSFLGYSGGCIFVIAHRPTVRSFAHSPAGRPRGMLPADAGPIDHPPGVVAEYPPLLGANPEVKRPTGRPT